MPANSELIIDTKVDLGELRTAMTKMDNSLNEAAKHSHVNKILEDKLFDGFKHGAKKGARSISSDLKTGLLAVSAVVAAAVASTFDEVMNNFDETADRVKERADQIRELSQNAGALGIKPEQMEAMSIAGQSMGYDTGDITGMIQGFASHLGDANMKHYDTLAKSHGMMSAFMSFLNDSNGVNSVDRAKALDSILGGDDAVKAGAIADKMKTLQDSGQKITFQALIDMIAGFHVDQQKLKSGQEKTLKAQSVINHHAAQRNYNHMVGGVSKQEAKDVASVEDAKDKQANASESAIHLKAQKAIFDSKVKIDQIKVGKATITSAISSYDSAGKIPEKLHQKTQESLKKYNSNPTTKNRWEFEKNVITESNEFNQVSIDGVLLRAHAMIDLFSKMLDKVVSNESPQDHNKHHDNSKFED